MGVCSLYNLTAHLCRKTCTAALAQERLENRPFTHRLCLSYLLAKARKGSKFILRMAALVQGLRHNSHMQPRNIRQLLPETLYSKIPVQDSFCKHAMQVPKPFHVLKKEKETVYLASEHML